MGDDSLAGAFKAATEPAERVMPAPITFGAQEEQPKTAVELEQERHRARARKFGVEYVEPKKDLLLSRAELRTEIARQRAGDRKGFAVGIDVFSEEEKAKKQQRAQKFGLATVAKDETDEERKRRLRAERFGAFEQVVPDEAATMEVEALEVRKDVPEGAELRTDVIYAYGTDTLSTKDVLSYFSGYGPSFVEWINDSSCNVVFEDEFAAKRALLSLGTEEQGAMNEALPAPWYSGKPFARGDVRLPMSLRFACTADVKPEEGVVSRHLWVRGGAKGKGNFGGASRKRQRRDNEYLNGSVDEILLIETPANPGFDLRDRLGTRAGSESVVGGNSEVFGPAKRRKRQGKRGGKANAQGMPREEGLENKEPEAKKAEVVTDRFRRRRTDSDDDEDD